MATQIQIIMATAVSDDDDDVSVLSDIPSGVKFRNPHKKDSGILISDKVLSWWQELRTRKLSNEEFKEELSPFFCSRRSSSILLAPDLPAGTGQSFPC